MPPTYSASTTRHHVAARRKKRSRKENITVSVLAVSAFLLVIALLINLHIIEAVEDTYHVRLSQQLSTHHALLRRWYEHELSLSEFAANSSKLESSLASFVSNSEDKTRQTLKTFLREHVQRIDGAGYLIANQSGQVVIASREKSDGVQLTPQVTLFILKILADGPAIFGVDNARTLFPALGLDRPLLLVGSPVDTSQGKFAAISVLDPETEFRKLVDVFADEERTHSYLVSKEGVLISPLSVSVPAQLLDRLDPDNNELLYNLRISQPGTDQLTRSADALARGQSGVNVDGYRDFRDVKVMGGWVWDDLLQIGLVVEVERDAAFDLMSPLVYGEYALFVVLVLTAIGATTLRMRVRALAQEVDNLSNLGQYKLENKIGEGGMGSVYRARHALMQRPTAIKLLRRDQTSEEALQRFELEVQQTSQLHHPNTIEIYDFGVTESGRFFYVMELLEGFSLADLISEFGPQPQARVAHIMLQICRSLEEAHQQGIVHRDIKPPNVMLCRMGTEYDFVKVLDFGLVKEIASDQEMELTQTQSVTGTAAYIAPERLRNPRESSPAVDIYSIGVVTYNLLTAKDPFKAGSPIEMVSKILSSRPKSVAQRCDNPISDELAALVMACIDKEATNRPATCHEVIGRLENIIAQHAWSSKAALDMWQLNANKLVNETTKATHAFNQTEKE